MRIIVFFLICFLFFCCSNRTKERKNQKQESSYNSIVDAKVTIPVYAKKVILAYPAFSIKYKDNGLYFSDGTLIVCDDGKKKAFTEKLDNCDIEDMFSMTYDTITTSPSFLNDCGRGRNEELFKKMYGSTELAVYKNLVPVEWFGKKIMFSKINGAAEQLKKIACELKNKHQYQKYLANASTFYWRKVRGSNRLSAHSYGIAIDINTTYSNYWLWSNPKCQETDEIKYENRIPIEIVKVFEKYGFIWGGRWYHYDTMHFEFRPEFLINV